MNLPILWVRCDPEVITALFSNRDSVVQIDVLAPLDPQQHLLSQPPSPSPKHTREIIKSHTK
jgi:hypothetical protein